MESGILEVQADDPAAPLDFEHFCDTAGLTLLKSDAVDGLFTFHIRVGHISAGS
jgi:TusA-related sulfurtransferase